MLGLSLDNLYSLKQSQKTIQNVANNNFKLAAPQFIGNTIEKIQNQNTGATKLNDFNPALVDSFMCMVVISTQLEYFKFG